MILQEGRGLLGLGALQEKVQGIPPAFLKPLTKRRVFEGDTLRFNAEVFGLPSPDVKWFRNKTQLVPDNRTTIERDGDNISLEIRNLSKADQGEYICEAVNYVGEAKSVALVVVISQEARMIPAPPAVTHQHVIEFDVEEDEDSSRSPSPQEILLEVELDENEVKEFEKQVKIVTIPEYTADNKSMIISLDVLPSMYEEGAVDFITQESEDLKIAFEVTEMPPRFINPICDIETPESTSVVFECSLMGIPSPVVSWFKGNMKIPHDKKKYFHSSDGDNHFLKIMKTNTHDSGIYTCRAINVVGETLCRASLMVLNPQAYSGKARGRELTAVSLGSAKIQPQKFDLVVGNSSFDGEQTSEIEYIIQEKASGHFNLLITNVVQSDAGEFKCVIQNTSGEYSCTASNKFGQTTCTTTLKKWCAEGCEAKFQYKVIGTPHPQVQWFKGNQEIKPSLNCCVVTDPDGTGFLIMIDGQQRDSGLYTCRASNPFGEATCSAELIVIRKSFSVSHQKQLVQEQKGYKVSSAEEVTESRLYSVSLPGKAGVSLQEGHQMIYTIGTEERQTVASEHVESLHDLDVSSAVVNREKVTHQAAVLQSHETHERVTVGPVQPQQAVATPLKQVHMAAMTSAVQESQGFTEQHSDRIKSPEVTELEIVTEQPSKFMSATTESVTPLTIVKVEPLVSANNEQVKPTPEPKYPISSHQVETRL
uniref:Ig-like domain-containing protein n=1 Tax=Astyanax mexicanus TaxID=7994 RepID=A0A8B9RN02_ASTMX